MGLCGQLKLVLLMVVISALLQASTGDEDKKKCRDNTTGEKVACPPNIVFLLADDLGYSDIGYNNPDVITPVLDDLAYSGRVMTQHYSSMMCTPSRAALMTGRYPHKIQMQHFILTSTMPHCMPTDVPVLPETLQTMGYKTHLVGKWHLGYCREECLPTNRGFDTFYGLYGGMADQFSHYTVPPEPAFYDFRDLTEVDLSVVGNHTTDLFSDRSVEIIRAHEGEDGPLFLMVAYTVPHTPLQVPEHYKDMYSGVSDEKRRAVLAMITQMDAGVGRILAALNDTGMLDNTLIAFASDNGGDPTHEHSNGPYRGGKGSLWEGGTKTVAFLNGPMLDSAPAETNGMFHIIDWAPTLLAIAGRREADKDEDGVDQSDLLLRGRDTRRDEFVYNIDLERPFSFGQAAIRDGDYKFMWGYEGTRDGWGDEAGASWNVPWNMELLGLDPVNDKIVKPPGQADNVLTPEDVKRRGQLMAMKAMSISNISIGAVHLFNLQDDPYEETDLADDPAFADKVTKMKEKIMDIIETDYLKPHSLVTADWTHEAEQVMGLDNAWSTGWCNNVSFVVYPPSPGGSGGLTSGVHLLMVMLTVVLIFPA